jgi:RNA polymerase sigma factor (sigma-70 family)
LAAGSSIPLADAQLYHQAVDDDRSAVRAIVERYHQQLVAYGRANGWAEAEVQDAVQIAWMNFFRMIESVRSGDDEGLHKPESLRFWLVTAVRNALHDEYRKSKRYRNLADRAAVMDVPAAAVVEVPDFLSGIELDERRSLVRRVFGRLGQTCRELISLLLIDPPLPYAEVAYALGKPVGSIGPTRQRCIDQIKSLVAETA